MCVSFTTKDTANSQTNASLNILKTNVQKNHAATKHVEKGTQNSADTKKNAGDKYLAYTIMKDPIMIPRAQLRR